MDKNQPVMITGATGYVAGWIVKRLLDEGYTVHAPIRSPENPEKTKHLDELAAASPGNIKYFKADLLTEGSYLESMKGCSTVIHTASPFIRQVKDAQKDLVDPALKGTRNVLDSVNQTPSVKKVVLTSSCAAIYGDNIDVEGYPNKTLTEEIWNTSSSLTHQPYSYSKTVAEKEAWKMAKEQDRWSLVTINPSLVMGPGISPTGTSESFNIMKQMSDGTMKMGTPDFHIGMVDVRDVAEAHFQATVRPDAEGRHIVSGHNTNFLEMGQVLRNVIGDGYPFPKKNLPNWLVMIMGPLNGMKRPMLRNNLGYKWKADNSKSREKLGITYRSMDTSLGDFFNQLVETGQIKKR
jgi:dihydroflavonol-4-reductase